IRHRFGLYDEITSVNGRTVRHCNWIRFLRVSETYGPQVNVVCAKVKGEPIYEIVKPIPSHQELVVYYLPEGPEELFFIRMRSQLYRQTMDSILEDSPLDLSTSLLSRVMLPISPSSGAEDEHKSVSGDDSSISISSGASTGGDRLCSKSFPTPGDLKSHTYVHNGSWPFKCHICSRGFSKQTNLKNHLFLHTGDKPHVCEVCKKSFALACNLKAHMKTHEENASQESEIDVDSDLRSDGEEIGPLFSYEKPDERLPRYRWRHSKAEPMTRSR
uniref:C2H2-type domain-containing protein n=1 Tax=Anopheles epiroticus TaxID=199890 RepID=A0A182PA88_9DIPT